MTMTYQYADLHLHTCFSDGAFTPAQVLDLAQKKGFSVVSITDHDTVAGVAEALALAPRYGIEVIPGIELSCVDSESEIHILGYFIDIGYEPLVARLRDMQLARLERGRRMIEALNRLNVPMTFDRVLQLAPHGVIGRLHVARALMEDKFVRSISEAFVRYLGQGCPAFFPKYKLSPAEAVDLIRSAGGVSVLAHPMNPSTLPRLESLVRAGIEGVEVFYPDHSETQTESCYDAARKYNLLMTGGSDCHGTHKKEVMLGRVKLPIDYVERLKQYHAYRRYERGQSAG